MLENLKLNIGNIKNFQTKNVLFTFNDILIKYHSYIDKFQISCNKWITDVNKFLNKQNKLTLLEIDVLINKAQGKNKTL